MALANLRVRMGRVPLDAVTLADAIERVVDLAEGGCGGTVYTPNVDHIVVAENNTMFRDAYAQVSLSLVDGTPVLWAARLLGFSIPAKVSGSDLFEPLVERAADRGLSVFLVGGQSGVAELARDRLCERYPNLQIVGVRSPLLDAEGNAEREESLLEEIRAAAPALVFVACGAPKSELFSYRHRAFLRPAVLICVGAAIDFAAGTLRRAPRWVSRIGLEWLYRLMREPRRLARRYLLRDPLFFWIFGKQLAALVGQTIQARLLPAFQRRSLPPLAETGLPPRSETRAIAGASLGEEVLSGELSRERAGAEEGVAQSGVLEAPGTRPAQANESRRS